MSKHQVNQRELPIVFAGAGLPQLPSLTSEAQTYAERMFAWPENRSGRSPCPRGGVPGPCGVGVDGMSEVRVRMAL